MLDHNNQHYVMSSSETTDTQPVTSVLYSHFQLVKVKADIVLPGGNPTSELRDVTCHMGSHTVACHPTQVNTPHLTPAIQAGTRFTYPGAVSYTHLTLPTKRIV